MTQQAEPTDAIALRPDDPGWPALVICDSDGTVTHWSRSATAVYGWTVEEAIGRPIFELTVDPEEAGTAAAIMGRLAAGDPWEGSFRVRHRDGSTFVAHVMDTPVLDAGGRLVSIIGLSYPIGEERLPLLAAERSARSSAERATERLRRLQRLTADLSRAMTTDDAISLVLNQGMELEGAGSGSIWLLGNDDLLHCRGAVGMHPDARIRYATIPLDVDMPGAAVVRAQRPVFLRSRAHRDEAWPAIAGTPTDMEAVAVVPLVVDGKSIGCVSYGFPDQREFGEGERDFLTALANVSAQVLDRARLYEAERAASRRVAFLAEASHVLNGTLDYAGTLEHVVSLLLQAFAAFVIVDLMNPDGSLERVAMGHVDPEKRAAMDALRRNPVRPGTVGWEVLRTGEPRVQDEVTDAELRTAFGDGPAYEAARSVDIGPGMVVPLTARGRVVGVLYVARPHGAEPFSDADLELAVDLAARAGSAVDNARLFAARTAVAVTLQQTLLPPRLPDVPGLQLAARYRPLHAGLEVGGDFYDCFPVRDGWAFMIGDVVGNGPKAAAITAVVRNTARAVAPYVTGPVAVVRAVREALVAGDDDEVFCTMLYGSIERDDAGIKLRVVGAGHPAPYVVRASGEVERVETTGSLLGAITPTGLDALDVRLAPGDSLVGVTDGVLEARRSPAWDDSPRFFDESGLREVLRSTAGSPVDDVAGAIEDAVLSFTGGRAPDDVAILVLRAE